MSLCTNGSLEKGWDQKGVVGEILEILELMLWVKISAAAAEKLSHEKTRPYFPLYWLLNRDPYNGYYNPHMTGQYNPLYTLNNQGCFHCSIVFFLLILENLWA